MITQRLCVFFQSLDERNQNLTLLLYDYEQYLIQGAETKGAICKSLHCCHASNQGAK